VPDLASHQSPPNKASQSPEAVSATSMSVQPETTETLGYEICRDHKTGTPSYKTISTDTPQEKSYRATTLYPRIKTNLTEVPGILQRQIVYQSLTIMLNMAMHVGIFLALPRTRCKSTVPWYQISSDWRRPAFDAVIGWCCVYCSWPDLGGN
jgi:hypothetical protein